MISGPVKMRLQGSGVVDAAQNLEVSSRWDNILEDHCSRYPWAQGSIIPPANAIGQLDLGPTRWVLVIEKEVGSPHALILSSVLVC